MAAEIVLTQNGQVSDPREVGPGARITVRGSGWLEWTNGSLADARNGVAVWQAWPRGQASGFADTLRRMVVRARATGAVTVDIDESRKDEGAEGAFWQEQLPAWATDSSGIATGAVLPGGVVRPLWDSALMVSGTFTVTGSVIAAASNVEVPGTAITIPTGWLQPGDGLEAHLHWEIGGTTATTRQFAVAYQPTANAGTATNVENLGQLTDATDTPKDGSAIWVSTVTASGIKRSAVGNSTGIGANTTTFSPAAYNPATSYRAFVRVMELATAANSITVYRMMLVRRRNVA